MGKVIIKAHGETHELQISNTDYILAKALQAGIDMPYSCESGICTTCMVKCVQGDIEMETNTTLSEEEILEGYRLICVGKPMTEKTVIHLE